MNFLFRLLCIIVKISKINRNFISFRPFETTQNCFNTQQRTHFLCQRCVKDFPVLNMILYLNYSQNFTHIISVTNVWTSIISALLTIEILSKYVLLFQLQNERLCQKILYLPFLKRCRLLKRMFFKGKK